ncbi:hypothetical protein JJL45_11870 [Tamlana sp. s12]|uniref:hypothetical protein n=1 Tax=Tamlana sp. s12 TaxID=1630406 RepID=UPI0007FDEC3F|nr:hypothetical protein [Tamlana sp. s12]OBQ46374.1 hypothetical protein VQ01_15625 [Tamlana sp. s12]QQY81619.1 hypothetical protein JJL45_11870 [Tamlana sp. s12]
MNKKNKFIALIPALWTCLFDISITITHQPKEYWNGNLNTGNEANPIGDFIMKTHVSGIFIISILWLIFIGICGYYLPRKISRIFLLFVFLTHSATAISWITPNYGFWFTIIFMLFNSILFYQIDDKINKKNISIRI